MYLLKFTQKIQVSFVLSGLVFHTTSWSAPLDVVLRDTHAVSRVDPVTVNDFSSKSDSNPLLTLSGRFDSAGLSKPLSPQTELTRIALLPRGFKEVYFPEDPNLKGADVEAWQRPVRGSSGSYPRSSSQLSFHSQVEPKSIPRLLKDVPPKIIFGKKSSDQYEEAAAEKAVRTVKQLVIPFLHLYGYETQDIDVSDILRHKIIVDKGVHFNLVCKVEDPEGGSMELKFSGIAVGENGRGKGSKLEGPNWTFKHGKMYEPAE
ncbi:hypothetical protein J3R30DRAFT_1415531 [Lentinula aciculospora]|uniref:Uncharacterized protein n=1 Tax=Lentinula aciculospora TaxID=153920 RepID=A0A9W9ALQ8_9AGAR|nr:hypothetical protein J3R30DRAFT_1415531 [Lentinula aciculospora]